MKNAYESGKKTVEKPKDKAVTPKVQKNRSTEPSRSEIGFVDKSSNSTTTKNAEALDKFAKLTDLTIIMQDSIKSEDGKAANGYYKNRTIVLAKNSTLPMATVLAHESFHHLKTAAPKQATELEEFVKRVMFEDDPIKFDNEMKRLAKLYGRNEDEYLFEEFMGDQVVELYADPKLIEKLATENPTLGQKLLDFIKQFIESIKAIFGDTNTGNFFESYGIKEEAIDMLAATIKAAKESPAVVEETETKYSIEIPYAKQVDMVLQNILLKTSAVYVSETPQILLDAGMSQLPMLITQKHIRNIVAEKDVNDSTKHGLTTDQIKKLPELLDKPVMMADSISKNDSVIVVTSEIDADGFPIIVSIKPNGKGTIMDVEMVDTNFVTSVYGRSNFIGFVETLYNKDALLYVNKIKSQELFNRIRIQFPQLLNNLDFDTIIKQSSNIVNNKLKNEASPAMSLVHQDELNTLVKGKPLSDVNISPSNENVKRFSLQDTVDKAIEEFGYTPYFYDAGYVLPTGKMLNFSGTKGQHYGSRGEDHRGIQSVFTEEIGRTESMLKFMGMGNIRIMAETPGIDIADTVEPTQEQYAKIRDFIRSKRDEEFFAVDFTEMKTEYGYTTGHLE